ncbi:MAG: UDP-glucose/GDP-mannose dehydrogenase family protein [Candidatus Caldarchaeales archaeon]
MTLERVAVVGLGYVGLSLACALASKGFRVIGLDKDHEKIKLIGEGFTPIYEEGLNDLLREVLEEGNLKLTSNYEEMLDCSDICFICVGTPSRPDGDIDLGYLEDASRNIGRSLKKKGYYLIVVRSTVPPGTTINIVKKIVEEESGKSLKDYGLCFNPEFLREGRALQDIFNPDRIIIGCLDKGSGEALLRFYKSFHGDSMPPVLVTSPTNAELIKYANNAFLAMKISFINMVSQLCQRLPGADVKVVAEGIGMDKRIGREFLNAGLGWGGSCLPKDTKGLLKFGERLGVRLPIIEATIEVNDSQIANALSLAEKLVGNISGKRIAVLGLAFKPGTDDIRESRSIRLVEELLKLGARVRVHDPKALEKAKEVLGEKVSYTLSIEECLQDADLCILATDWEEYKVLRQEILEKIMKNPALLDCRRLYDPRDFERVKFAAIGLG